jgi:hypothetical protein
MSSYWTLILEFEEGEAPDRESLPDWITEASKDFQFNSNYLYIQKAFNMEKSSNKLKRDFSSIDRVAVATWNDTSDMGHCTLYDVNDSEIQEIVEIPTRLNYKALEPKVESVTNYFQEKYGFELKQYDWDGLGSWGGYFKLEDDGTKHR